MATFTLGMSGRRGNTHKFQHADALGSTRGITDSTQATTDAILYDAFGMTVSRTGSTPTPFGFGGGSQYQTDSDSGLMLLGNRYYDASVGRFISSDPIQDGDNWYAYCENNPLCSADPLGLMPHDRKKQSTGKSKKGIHEEGVSRAGTDQGTNSQGGEKGDIRRKIARPKKAGTPGSSQPVNPNIGNQGRDRGKRNEDQLPKDDFWGDFWTPIIEHPPYLDGAPAFSAPGAGGDPVIGGIMAGTAVGIVAIVVFGPEILVGGALVGAGGGLLQQFAH